MNRLYRLFPNVPFAAFCAALFGGTAFISGKPDAKAVAIHAFVFVLLGRSTAS